MGNLLNRLTNSALQFRLIPDNQSEADERDHKTGNARRIATEVTEVKQPLAHVQARIERFTAVAAAPAPTPAHDRSPDTRQNR